MNCVPCVAWVKRGAAKAIPDKVSLNTDDFKRMFETIQSKESDDEEEAAEVCDDEDIDKKYGLDTYDDEIVDETANSLAGLTVFASNESDPILDQNQIDDSDEENDFQILPTDNLIAVGHLDQNCSILEVYVYNEEQDNLYVHHDIILPAFPVSLEWLDFDPSDSNPANYIAVGDMTPVINIWDLDLVDTLEPVLTLGTKTEESGKKRKVKKKLQAGEHIGHTDAVVDVKWNKFARFVLASGSVDKTVILWDLNKAQPVTTLRHHSNQISSIAWHPFEMQTLLTSSDRTIVGCDCRSPEENFKTWTTDADVEHILWNHFDPYYFLASNDQGFVQCFDFRTEGAVFTLKAHNSAINAMSLSPQCPGCLVTTSIDKTMKVWDIQNNQPQFVFERDLKVGQVYAISTCPEAPCTVACGGDNRANSFTVLDLRRNKTFRDHFADRLRLDPSTATKYENDSNLTEEVFASSKAEASAPFETNEEFEDEETLNRASFAKKPKAKKAKPKKKKLSKK